jgi:hypothetical protein
MKYLVILAFLLAPLTSYADMSMSYLSLVLQGVRFTMTPLTPKETSVRVLGVGKNRDEAIQNGLLTAVQQTVGVMLITDQVVNNDRLVRNVVAQYSSGSVTKFDVHSCDGTNPVMCDMTVSVSLTSFMRKLENVSDNVQFSGNDYFQKHMLQRTLLIQREKMLDYYLRQIHQSGLDVEVHAIDLLPDPGEKVKISVEYRIKWNETFRKELLSFFRKLEKDTANINGSTVYIQWGTTGLSDNRAYIKTHSQSMHTNTVNLIHQPLMVQFNGLGVCRSVDIQNIFDLGRRGKSVKTEFFVEPDKLKNMTHLHAKIGCDS